MQQNRKWSRWAPAAILGISLIVSAPIRSTASDADDTNTKTPIKHIVVIFQENVSFDHYFGTYPHAQPNLDHSVLFTKVQDDTPRVNGLESSGLLTANPNVANPFRIDRSHPVTCDQDHAYGDEQWAFDNGLLDRFAGTWLKNGTPFTFSCNDTGVGGVGLNSVMGYYDGNTVTALWNYAQHFAMNDNSFGTSFGPSTPGLLNLVAGNTYPASITNGLSGAGNIANAGSFGAVMGGFTNCATVSHVNVAGATVLDYIPHHAFFQYWTSTANPSHKPPTSTALIGRNADQANHQYDLSNFFQALNSDHLPAVSFLKAAAYQDGHAGYSDPLDEQQFLVQVINALQTSKEWKETAVIVMYDDSDGWYDHQMGPIVMQSNIADDWLTGLHSCTTTSLQVTPPSTVLPAKTFAQNGRCGFGPRMPFLVISPWAKTNYVDHNVTDQSSVIRFVEDNWGLSRIGGGSTDAIAGTINGMFDFDDKDKDKDKDSDSAKLILNPFTGTPVDVDKDKGKDKDKGDK